MQHPICSGSTKATLTLCRGFETFLALWLLLYPQIGRWSVLAIRNYAWRSRSYHLRAALFCVPHFYRVNFNSYSSNTPRQQNTKHYKPVQPYNKRSYSSQGRMKVGPHWKKSYRHTCLVTHPSKVKLVFDISGQPDIIAVTAKYRMLNSIMDGRSTSNNNWRPREHLLLFSVEIGHVEISMDTNYLIDDRRNGASICSLLSFI